MSHSSVVRAGGLTGGVTGGLTGGLTGGVTGGVTGGLRNGKSFVYRGFRLSTGGVGTFFEIHGVIWAC